MAFAANSTATQRWRSTRRSPSSVPASVGETLVAEAVERMRAGRSGMYDVRVSTAGGELVAEFRGHTRTLRGTRGRRKPMAGLDPIETASRDEIAALQRERIAWTLRHAYANVPHYRAAFDAAGVHPDDFRQLEDLAKFPFTTKQDLRANYPFGMFAVPRERIVRIHASSGTTGKPTVVGYTQRGSGGLGAGGGALDLRRRRAAGDDPAQRLWLRAVHRRPGHARRRATPGMLRRAGVRRHDRAPGAAHQRFPARHHHRDAQLHAGDSR